MPQLIKVTPNAYIDKKDITYLGFQSSCINRDRWHIIFTLKGGEKFEIALTNDEKKFVADLFEAHKDSEVFNLYDLINENQKKMYDEEEVQDRRLCTIFREIETQSRRQ